MRQAAMPSPHIWGPKVTARMGLRSEPDRIDVYSHSGDGSESLRSTLGVPDQVPIDIYLTRQINISSDMWILEGVNAEVRSLDGSIPGSTVEVYHIPATLDEVIRILHTLTLNGWTEIAGQWEDVLGRASELGASDQELAQALSSKWSQLGFEELLRLSGELIDRKRIG